MEAARNGEFAVLDRRIGELEHSLLDLDRHRDEFSEQEFLEREISLVGEWEGLRSLLEMCRLPIPEPPVRFREAWNRDRKETA